MIKGEFEIRRSILSDNLVTVTGWEFAVFGYFNCVVHRSHRRPNEWTVTEPRTGLFVTRGHKTRKGAIGAATQVLYSNGTQEEIVARLEYALSNYKQHTKYELARRVQENNGRLNQDQ